MRKLARIGLAGLPALAFFAVAAASNLPSHWKVHPGDEDPPDCEDHATQVLEPVDMGGKPYRRWAVFGDERLRRVMALREHRCFFASADLLQEVLDEQGATGPRQRLAIAYNKSGPGGIDAVEGFAQGILAEHPGDPGASLALARRAYDAGDWLRAQRLLDSARSMPEDDLELLVLERQLDFRVLASNPIAREINGLIVNNRVPKATRTQLALEWLNWVSPERAESDARAMTEGLADVLGPDVHRFLVSRWLAQGRNQDAIEFLQSSLEAEHSFDDVDLVMQLAELHLQRAGSAGGATAEQAEASRAAARHALARLSKRACLERKTDQGYRLAAAELGDCSDHRD